MLEDRAKEKMCPIFVSKHIIAQGLYALDIVKCKASECMLWRWAEGDYNDTLEIREKSIEGYCGLGGKE